MPNSYVHVRREYRNLSSTLEAFSFSIHCRFGVATTNSEEKLSFLCSLDEYLLEIGEFQGTMFCLVGICIYSTSDVASMYLH